MACPYLENYLSVSKTVMSISPAVYPEPEFSLLGLCINGDLRRYTSKKIYLLMTNPLPATLEAAGEIKDDLE